MRALRMRGMPARLQEPCTTGAQPADYKLAGLWRAGNPGRAAPAISMEPAAPNKLQPQLPPWLQEGILRCLGPETANPLSASGSLGAGLVGARHCDEEVFRQSVFGLISRLRMQDGRVQLLIQ